MKYTIILLLMLSGCAPYYCKDATLSYYYGCFNTTLRLCKWEQKCIDKNLKVCEIETNTMIELVCGK